MENDYLFKNEVLKLLPLNCRLYKSIKQEHLDNEKTSSFKNLNSSFYQNDKMELIRGFYKSITRLSK